MLVLGRRRFQTVVIADEITLTVEEICDGGDGRHIFGATVRLGFETPPYVSICRGELQTRRPRAARTAQVAKRPQPQTGEVVKVADAQVRLRVQVPRKVPVCHNGTPTVGQDSQEGPGGEPHGLTAVHHVTCSKDDRIAICNNITIAALDFRRFIPNAHDSCLAKQGATEQ